MERVVECLPEFSRSEVLRALDTLSRQGAITLGRRGFEYELRAALAFLKSELSDFLVETFS